MLLRRAARLPRNPFLAPAGDPGDSGRGEGSGVGLLLAFFFAARTMSPYVTGDCGLGAASSDAPAASPDSGAPVGSAAGGAAESVFSSGRLRFRTRLSVLETPLSSAAGVLGVLGRPSGSSLGASSE